MRVVVLGATGNVGTSLLRALEHESRVAEVVGVARREPELKLPKVRWQRADITQDDLATLFRGADAVVHLAWAIQPSRDRVELRRINVEGSRRVLQAVTEAKVPSLVYASSIGAYSPGPKTHPVDESWPSGGVASSFYSRHKSEVERMLDNLEAEAPSLRIVRLRPALIFKPEAAAEIRRLFAGPLLPGFLLRRSLIPIVPATPHLRFQCVHSHDVGEAYRLALVSEVSGAFNIAADPILDPDALSKLFGASQLRLPEPLVRFGAWITWRLHLQPTPPGWVDMGLATPLIDWSRAHKELGWTPTHSSGETLLELVEGFREGRGFDTPPLAPRAGGLLRSHEFGTGVGKRAGIE